MKQALIKTIDGAETWVNVLAVREAPSPPSTRLALLNYVCGPNNETGAEAYVTAVTHPRSEAEVAKRPNFVRWLGPRFQVIE